jgi:Protein of unknown function (DUF3147)
MGIRFHGEEIRKTRAREHAIRFLFGGGVTLVAGLVAERFGPEIGGLFLAFPAIIPASLTLIANHEERKKREHGLNGKERGKDAAALDVRGATMGSCGLLLFGLLCWMLLPVWPIGAVLGVATVAWLLSAILIWQSYRKIRFGSR